VVLVAVAAALAAACLFAGAAVLQQLASRRTVAREPDRLTGYLPVVRVVTKLLHEPLWLLGWGVNLLGFLVQAGALHLGSVALVQPVLTTQLLFALSFTALVTHRSPSGRDWLAVAALCAGVVVFLSVRGAAPLGDGGSRGSVLGVLTVAAVAVLATVVLARGREPVAHAAVLGVGAGICFAVSAVLMTLTTADLLERGVAATATDWPGYALAVSTALGLLLGQQAYAVGSLPVAVAAMAVTNPVVSYVLGILAFDVAVPGGWGAGAAVLASGLLLAAGATGLASSPTITHDAAQRPAQLAALRPCEDCG
jgi:drug/metabolite transporter (DMT)-like permease